MIFQFLITYRRTEQTEIENVLVELLSKVLEDNFNEVESSVIQEMIRVQYERTGGVSSDETGMASSYAILSFIVDLADETSQIETVVDEFATQLMETPPIFHAVKFEDPILHFELLQRAEEIFALEMKLRRVLTFIYLFANQGNDDPYDLLSDEAVQPMSKERPQMAQMKAAAENQFFHLTFGQYVNLNHRLEFKQVSALLEVGVCLT